MSQVKITSTGWAEPSIPTEQTPSGILHQTPIPEAEADSYIASKNDQTTLHVYLKNRKDKLKSGKKKMDVKYRFRADANFTKKKQNSGVTIF